MGRCLYYTVRKESGFSKSEIDHINNMVRKFNSGEYKDIWSCENFYIDTKENAAKSKQYTFSGFTKVQGNEYNAMVISMALLEISQLIPKAKIDFSDEGRYLICPIIIQNGTAVPNTDSMLSRVNTQCRRYVLRNCLGSLTHSNFKTEDFKMSLGIDNPYKDALTYLDDTLLDLRTLEHRLVAYNKTQKEPLPLFFSNFENYLKAGKGFPIMIFVRDVNPDDFIDYKRWEGTLMAGFYGEYWKLTNKDAEYESFTRLAFISKAIEPFLKEKNMSMEILGGTHEE